MVTLFISTTTKSRGYLISKFLQQQQQQITRGYLISKWSTTNNK